VQDAGGGGVAEGGDVDGGDPEGDAEGTPADEGAA
jgi:hypothetical protein